MPGLIRMSFACAQPVVQINSSVSNRVLISLTVNPEVVPPDAAGGGAAGAEMVLVLDRSGSMSQTSGPDGKSHIRRVIDAALAVAEMLGPKDRLGVFGFDDDVYPVLGLTPGSERPKILAALHGFGEICKRTGGCTYMAPALAAALEEVRKNAINRRGARIVILTDGDADDPVETLDVVRVFEGQSVASLGFGTFNFELMTKVCESGGGICENVGGKAPTDLEKFFRAEFDVARSTIASNLRLLVKPAETINLVHAFITHPHPAGLRDANGKLGLDRDRSGARLPPLPPFEREFGMGILVEFGMDRDERRPPGPWSPMEVELRYDAPGLGLMDQCVTGQVVVEYTADASRVNMKDNAVQEALDRAMAAVALEQAKILAEAGKTTTAADILTNIGPNAPEEVRKEYETVVGALRAAGGGQSVDWEQATRMTRTKASVEAAARPVDEDAEDQDHEDPDRKD